MKRTKCWWQFFVLCCACVLTAIIFVSCNKGVNASLSDAPEPDQPTGEVTAAPTAPEQPTNPVTPPEPEVPPHQHTYGEWELQAAATCQHPDIERRDCTDEGCDAYETRTINQPLEHACLGTTTTNPTCTEAGCETFRCQFCDYSYTKTIPPLGHDYTTTQPTCSRCGATNPDFPVEEEPTISPLEKIKNSYWYLDTTASKKWGIYFTTFDQTTNQGAYCTYEYDFTANGTVVIKDKDNPFKYHGTFAIYSDNTIKLDDDNLSGSSYDFDSILTYNEIEDEDTGKVLYTLSGAFLGNYEIRTLIFAGYDL